MKRFSAFTLAEILIILGIIGIVAAMTMPSLIKNYDKKATAARVKQAYSIIAQAVKLSEVENGSAEDWVASSEEKGLAYTELFMNKFLLPYFKAEYCGEGQSDEVKKKCGAIVSKYGKNYFLPNGTAVAFVPGLAFSSDENMVFHVVIDTNGPKNPNIMGVDQFYFQYVMNNGFKAYGASSNCSRNSILNGTCSYKDFEVNCMNIYTKGDKAVSSRDGCSLLLMMDGWEFKDDYPWKHQISE